MILAFDTSCYTSSVALMTTEGILLSDQRRVLDVPAKQRGLLQSEALFQHIHNVPGFIENLAKEYDFSKITKKVDPKHIWLRLSPWNLVETSEDEYGFKGLLKLEDVVNKKPVSSSTLKEIIDQIESLKIAYAYAPAIDEEIKNNVACGQALEAFKKEIANI